MQLRQLNNVTCSNFWISPFVKNLSNRCQAFAVGDVRVKSYDFNSNKNRSIRKPPNIFEFVKKSLVSLPYEGICGTKGFSWQSTNSEIFSVGVLHPDITGLPGRHRGKMHCTRAVVLLLVNAPLLKTIGKNNKLGFRPRILKNLSSRHQT